MKILLVDDHELVRDGLRRLLEGEPDWQVVGEYSNAGDCLMALQDLTAGLALIDLHLPGESGLSLVAELQERFPGLPTLVLSSAEDIDTVVEALRAGAGGYLVKSARREELLSAVRTVAAGGAYLHPRIAPAVLRQLREAPRRSAVQADITPRERSIIGFVTQGLSNVEISEKLFVSLGTVKNDLSLIFRKLGVRDRAQLAAESATRGWV